MASEEFVAPEAFPACEPDLRTTVVFHLADVTGPAKSLRPRLEALARRGVALEVLAPGEGSLACAYGDLGTVRALPYASLTVPRTLHEGVERCGRSPATLPSSGGSSVFDGLTSQSW